MTRTLVFLLLVLGSLRAVNAQNPNLGIPFIQSYPKDVYQSGAQNWDIAQDSRGVMYFANNNGFQAGGVTWVPSYTCWSFQDLRRVCWKMLFLERSKFLRRAHQTTKF